MFIGHFGVGLGAKAAAPRTSLGTLFLASQFIDLLWPALLLLGIERVEIQAPAANLTPLKFVSYPISHSLLMVCFWGVLIGAGYWLLWRRVKSALVIGLCVVSHWCLDLIVHGPDLPLYPGESPKLGLGLWDSLAGTLLVEGLFFVVGLFLYLRVTKARNRTGVYAFWTLIGVLVAIYLSNILGPPPPSVTAIAWIGQLQWLLVAWAYWADRNRTPRTQY
jgi:membrane-bound metal-dependent hydrolase YbcI (DUF457 family)